MSMLNELLPNLRDLRVTNNLLGSWAQVHTIVRELRALDTLDVSGNFLQQAEDVASLQPCVQLRTLVSSRCHITWKDVRDISKVFPRLRELYASENDIEALQPPLQPDDSLCQLQVLDVMGNRINSWDEVMTLSVMTQLSVLKLSSNNVSNITPAGEQAVHKT
jgi:Leucine-rich repeat (LRR) protein